MIIPRYGVDIALKDLISISSGYKHFLKVNSEDVLFFNSATEAIVHYLKCIKGGKSLNIGVPVYACLSVYESVAGSGNNIVFLDISLNREGYTFNIDDLSSVDAIILIHYFGLRFEYLSEIRHKYPNLVIIEDCAHLSFMDYVPNPYSNISVYSFNLHKPIAAGSGGALIFNNESKNLQVKKSYDHLHARGTLKCILNYLRIIIRNYGYNPLIYSLLINKLEKNRYQTKFIYKTDIRVFKICFIAKFIIGNKLSHKKDGFTKDYLKIPEKMRLKGNLNDTTGLLYFPLFFSDSSGRNATKNILSKYGVDSFILWENTLYNCSKFGLTETERFPHTLDMLDKVLFLPENIFKDPVRLKKISALLNTTESDAKIS
jgi:DegT/DnrJ/EryC1/StrS aminotransferase family